MNLLLQPLDVLPLISGVRFRSGARGLTLYPYQCLWLCPDPEPLEDEDEEGEFEEEA